MNKSLLDKCYGLMSYGTYTTLQKCSLLSGSLSLIAFFPFLNAGLFPSKLFLYSVFSFLYYYFSDIYSFEDKTYDVKEVKKLYDEFIENYSNLNKMFNLNNPMEIYEMFIYLLYKGYLSKDKEFVYSRFNVCDVNSIRGVNVIKGNGVCRHIAPLLNDIFHVSGIVSYVLPVYQREWNPKAVFVDDSLTQEEKEHINKTLYELKKYNELVMFIKEKYGDKVIIKRKFFESELPTSSYANHVINMAIFDGYKYLLDPTQDRVYDYSLEKDILFDEEDTMIGIYPKRFREYNKNFKFKDVESKFLLPTFDYKNDDNALRTRIVSMVDDNLDIFERFYRENKPLYEEISDKLMRIRVRR